MNFAQHPKFKDKFKTLSLKFRPSGAARRSVISHKSVAKFRHAEVKFQGINLLRRISKRDFLAKFFKSKF
ncbi:hypothetical protein [uncultured Campylobacter sp.]|uniref:hypothetical protein n=1 Tax=uncultured Campylobacter sp. TaxID=218934 RepID=UPI0026066E40|nr:hypothetical protein [uncultured Campylobacter sp.]